MAIELLNIGFVLAVREPNSRSTWERPSSRCLIEHRAEAWIDLAALLDEVIQLRGSAPQHERVKIAVCDEAQGQRD